jgi:serine/threonine protein kinase
MGGSSLRPKSTAAHEPAPHFIPEFFVDPPRLAHPEHASNSMVQIDTPLHKGVSTTCMPLRRDRDPPREGSGDDAATVLAARGGDWLQPGRLVLGDFRIESKLGEGGMGAVYKGRQLSLARDVAIKVLPPRLAEDEGFLERFYREAKASGALDHPNIVRGVIAGEDHGCHFFVMEFVRGENLETLLKRIQRFSVADAVKITLEVARALHHAHSHAIIHRDIKPSNIMVTPDGQVKLLDLGLAKALDDDLGLTQVGDMAGTPAYMPPEQARNAKAADARCDIFALGATLYVMVTGKKPFAGNTTIAVLESQERGAYQPALPFNTEVTEQLDTMIRKMLAPDPARRFQTAAELIDALEKTGLASAHLAFEAPTRLGPAPSVVAPRGKRPAPVAELSDRDAEQPTRPAAAPPHEAEQPTRLAQVTDRRSTEPAGLAGLSDRGEAEPTRLARVSEAVSDEPRRPAVVGVYAEPHVKTRTTRAAGRRLLVSGVLTLAVLGGGYVVWELYRPLEEQKDIRMQTPQAGAEQSGAMQSATAPPSSSPLIDVGPVDTVLARAMQQLASDRLEEARATLAQALEAHPRDQEIERPLRELESGALVLFQYQTPEQTSSVTPLWSASGVTLTSRDNYRFAIIPGRQCFLYAFQRDQQPSVSRLFPNPQFSTQSNPLPAGRLYWLPADAREERSWLHLDTSVGEEQVYFVAVTKPLRDPEDLERQLKYGGDRILETMKRDLELFLENGGAPGQACFADAGSAAKVFQFSHR